MKVKMILPSLQEAESPYWRPIKYSLFPPLGLATLAAYFSEDDEVEIVDQHVERLTLDDEPDMVCIQVYVTNAYRAYRIADHYRQKGGRFRRKSDFARSYVVADSVYERLEPFIDIPRLDINRADSAAFMTLPGIGKFFAGKMVSYRKELGGYSSVEQLLDIWHFDEEKLAGIRDLISCSQPEPWPLWTAGEAELRSHPYIRSSAHGIVLYRQYQGKEKWTLEGLRDAGVLSDDQFARLSRCRLAAP